MQDTLLPLFPLEVVLLPSNGLPLHIFEDRYKEMIGESVRNQSEFGIVQAGEKGILNIGCTALVKEVVKQYPDGRMDIVAVGRRRFEIIFLDETKSFLRAAVNYFDDIESPPAPEDARIMALACYKLLNGEQGVTRVIPAPDDPQLSFRVVEHLSDLSFRQTLLAMRSEAERIAHINEFLPDYLASLRRASHVRKVAPRNGHGFIALGKRPK